MDYKTVTVDLNPEEPPRTGIDWRKVDVEPVEPRRSPRARYHAEPGVSGAAVMYASSETVNAVMAYADAFAGALLQWVARGLQ